MGTIQYILYTNGVSILWLHVVYKISASLAGECLFKLHFTNGQQNVIFLFSVVFIKQYNHHSKFVYFFFPAVSNPLHSFVRCNMGKQCSSTYRKITICFFVLHTDFLAMLTGMFVGTNMDLFGYVMFVGTNMTYPNKSTQTKLGIFIETLGHFPAKKNKSF